MVACPTAEITGSADAADAVQIGVANRGNCSDAFVGALRIVSWSLWPLLRNLRNPVSQSPTCVPDVVVTEVNHEPMEEVEHRPIEAEASECPDDKTVLMPAPGRPGVGDDDVKREWGMFGTFRHQVEQISSAAAQEDLRMCFHWLGDTELQGLRLLFRSDGRPFDATWGERSQVDAEGNWQISNQYAGSIEVMDYAEEYQPFQWVEDQVRAIKVKICKVEEERDQAAKNGDKNAAEKADEKVKSLRLQLEQLDDPSQFADLPDASRHGIGMLIPDLGNLPEDVYACMLAAVAFEKEGSTSGLSVVQDLRAFLTLGSQPRKIWNTEHELSAGAGNVWIFAFFYRGPGNSWRLEPVDAKLLISPLAEEARGRSVDGTKEASNCIAWHLRWLMKDRRWRTMSEERGIR